MHIAEVEVRAQLFLSDTSGFLLVFFISPCILLPQHEVPCTTVPWACLHPSMDLPKGSSPQRTFSSAETAQGSSRSPTTKRALQSLLPKPRFYVNTILQTICSCLTNVWNLITWFLWEGKGKGETEKRNILCFAILNVFQTHHISHRRWQKEITLYFWEKNGSSMTAPYVIIYE